MRAWLAIPPLAVALLGAAAPAFADTKSLTSPAAIEQLLRSVPTVEPSLPARTLAERLPDLGLKVEKVVYGPFQPAEIQISRGDLMKGDVSYEFRMNEVPAQVRARCPLLSTVWFIKRGSRWLPSDRSANYLVSGRCVAPGA